MRTLLSVHDCNTAAYALRSSSLSLVLTLLAASLSFGQTSRIVFVGDQSGSPQIYTMDPDGSHLTQLTNFPPGAYFVAVPIISPDGTKIAFSFVQALTDGALISDLYAINVDGSGLRPLTRDHHSFLARWSPDGTMLVFGSISKRTNAGVITVMHSDGSGPRRALTTDLWDSLNGSYTPDGKQIVYYSQEGGLISAVWIMNANGSQKRRLTDAALEAFPGGVSPDGQQILFWNHQNSPPALNSDLFVMNLDGLSLMQLTTGGPHRRHNYGGYYSPDGKSIVYQTDAFHRVPPGAYGVFDIVTIDADGSNPTIIKKNAGSCEDGNCVTPSWGVAP